MPTLNIKNPRVYQLAKALADITGRSMSSDIEDALESHLVALNRDLPLARLAYRESVRGSGHPARLNFGDCFSYAPAVDKSDPLLFDGDDFSQTDVLAAS